MSVRRREYAVYSFAELLFASEVALILVLRKFVRDSRAKDLRVKGDQLLRVTSGGSVITYCLISCDQLTLVLWLYAQGINISIYAHGVAHGWRDGALVDEPVVLRNASIRYECYGGKDSY